MTTLVRPDAPDRRAAGARHRRAPHEPSRYAAWRSSWAVALRMARRDVRRHKGRSALIVVMVAVPTLLLSLVVTLAATSRGRRRREDPVRRWAAARPWSRAPTAARSLQGADPNSAGRRLRRARPTADPRVRPRRPAPSPTRMPCPPSSGAPVSPLSHVPGPHDRRRAPGQRRRASRSTARSASASGCGWSRGRWPQGTARGPRHRATASPAACPPAAGSRSASTATDHTFDVVGVAAAQQALQRRRGPRRAGAPDRRAAGRQRLDRPGQRPGDLGGRPPLNEYGLRVTSAAVLRDPPSTRRAAGRPPGGRRRATRARCGLSWGWAQPCCSSSPRCSSGPPSP